MGLDKVLWRFIRVKGDDNVSGTQIEDSQVSSRTSRETVNSGNALLSKIYTRKIRWREGQYSLIIISAVLTVFGLVQILFPPFDLLLDLRIRMTPGLPAYEWWVVPPKDAIVKIYLFNVTNSERFLNKTDNKLKLEEVGPIVFREILVHKNIVFNDNGTLSYTSNRTLQYAPEINPVNLLNKTIVMPNLAVFFIASYLYDASFFIRVGLNMMMRSLKSELFKTDSVHNFLWNTTDPILDTSQKIAPFFVPSKNVGILHRIYENYEDNVTVYIGPTFPHEDFFRIDKYDGSKFLPGLRECEIVKGAFDDLMYNQKLTKNMTLRFYRKELCRVANLKYARDIEKYSLNGYRYEMEPHFYDRIYPATEDCYHGTPSLPNGLTDVSACNYGVSLAASHPHFLYGDNVLRESVEGLKPDKEKHTSFTEVEPITGVPIIAAARSQCNLVIKNMKGFSERLNQFSNLIIPLAWIEVVQESLPLKVQWLVYIQVVILPTFQKILVIFTFLCALLALGIFLSRRRHQTKQAHSASNKTLTFEAENFLKR
ncbi:scavenger receptor class B member 1 isoform X2 [Diabrotica virgifera virgifera]|nr:scavenger receptor class B member 1 isoform X2 [Diabrotica virgifera virgifera]XP_050501601.1 scavenger receptor class B member 1 isoform X2 [Diabrotica virgifera virgifera]